MKNFIYKYIIIFKKVLRVNAVFTQDQRLQVYGKLLLNRTAASLIDSSSSLEFLDQLF